MRHEPQGRRRRQRAGPRRAASRHVDDLAWHTEPVPDDFVIARNPEAGSALPYLLRIPSGEQGIVLKARETWPRTAKVYCHRAARGRAEPEVVERVPVRLCERRGASDRPRARPRSREPLAVRPDPHPRWSRGDLLAVAAHGQAGPTQRRCRRAGARREWLTSRSWSTRTSATRTGSPRSTRPRRRRGLPAGDYAVALEDRIVAAVERKSLADLSAAACCRASCVTPWPISRHSVGRPLSSRTATRGSSPRARTTVDGGRWRSPRRRSACRTCRSCSARTRPLAEEWTYRFLAGSPRGACDRRRRRASATAGGRSAAGPPADDCRGTCAGPLRRVSPVRRRGRVRSEVWSGTSTRRR